jgi:hypothetical protein
VHVIDSHASGETNAIYTRHELGEKRRKIFVRLYPLPHETAHPRYWNFLSSPILVVALNSMDVSETATVRQRMGGWTPRFDFSRGTVSDVVIVALLWTLAVVIAQPIGEFPLNDDWSFGMTVKRLVDGLGYQPGKWGEMTLFSHALWGALFCIPHGFSFTALRFSTLVLSLTGALAMYGLIRQLQGPRVLALVCALTLVFNPIYFALSNTFMTDVPFAALAILSALFFVRHLQGGSDTDLVIGTIVAVISTLSRQIALCLPFALGVTLLLKHGFQGRWIIRAVLPLISCIVLLAVFVLWLKTTGKFPAVGLRREHTLATLLTHPKQLPVVAVIFVSWSCWSMLLYLGWFLSPLIFLTISQQRRPETSQPFCLPACVAVFAFFMVSVVRLFLGRSLGAPSLMPVHLNVIIPGGIGPATLRDTYFLGLPHLPALPIAFWLLVTVLSLVGAAILVFKTTRIIIDLFRKERFDRVNADGLAAIFFLLCTIVYLALSFLSGAFVDRYLIPVTAFLAAVIATSPEGRGFKIARAQKLAVILLIAGLGVFAVAGTRDYLEWNRTRWKALQALLAQKDVKPKDVDGGFEFNGWNGFDNDNIGTTPPQDWAIDATYVIAFGEIEGYEAVASYRYPNWMPPHEGKIVVLKRKVEN